MLFHYFMAQFQAVKPVTDPTRGSAGANRAQGGQKGPGLLLRSSPLPSPAGRAASPEVSTGLSIPAEGSQCPQHQPRG